MHVALRECAALAMLAVALLDRSAGATDVDHGEALIVGGIGISEAGPMHDDVARWVT